jgi:hypothetical protein
MNNPVEIEFAANLETPAGQPKIFNFLQIRPIVQNEQTNNLDIGKIDPLETIVWSDSALGNGIFKGIKDIVYIKPDTFNPADSKKITANIDRLNSDFLKQNISYVLIGPGRWGSADPWLGIPVKWHQISAARLIIESGLKNYRIDPSQGTHFFQNLTSFRVGYFTVNPYFNEGHYDIEWLNKQNVKYEDNYIRHVSFENPIEIIINGRLHKGVIMKPDASIEST